MRRGEVREVAETCRAQDLWRASTINLIASENVLSPAARAVLDSDFHHRYAEGHPGARYYEGTRFIDEIEARTSRVVAEIFRADRVDVRLPSGTTANEAVFSALLKEGGTALAHGIAGGGHISHAMIGALGKRADRILELPRLKDGFRLDAQAGAELIRKERPRLVVLGRSLFLFPEPVREMRAACDEVGAILLYDASHVLGLIAGGRFQDPLAEGAHVLTASCHKTFFGPQRGIIAAKGVDDDLWKAIDRAVFPGVTSNHHLFTLPALLVASLEVCDFGADYARAVIANAKAFAAALEACGLVVAAKDLGYTESHQVAVDVGDLGGGREASARLSRGGVICNMNLLPGEPGKNARNPRGIRLGVQEMTRFGMGPAQMATIAEWMRGILVSGRDHSKDAASLRAGFSTVRFGYGIDAVSEAKR